MKGIEEGWKYEEWKREGPICLTFSVACSSLASSFTSSSITFKGSTSFSSIVIVFTLCSNSPLCFSSSVA